MLTQERQERIRKAILQEIYRESGSSSKDNNNDPLVDFMLFQEVTVDDSWDDNPFFFSETNTSTSSGNISTSTSSSNSNNNARFGSLYERIPCPSAKEPNEKNLRRVYVRKSSGWSHKNSIPLYSNVLVGGCLVEFEFNFDSNSNSGKKVRLSCKVDNWYIHDFRNLFFFSFLFSPKGIQ